jgi:hypothetical protein
MLILIVEPDPSSVDTDVPAHQFFRKEQIMGNQANDLLGPFPDLSSEAPKGYP